MIGATSREEIPDTDDVSRWIFIPLMGRDFSDLIWEVVFMFPSSGGYRESVVWRKYAPTIQDVHQLGCDKQREFTVKDKKREYAGALTGGVGHIREYRNQNNHGFYVVHEPSGGIHHAEIGYLISDENKLTKHDKTDLRSALMEIFSRRDAHTCL